MVMVLMHSMHPQFQGFYPSSTCKDTLVLLGNCSYSDTHLFLFCLGTVLILIHILFYFLRVFFFKQGEIEHYHVYLHQITFFSKTNRVKVVTFKASKPTY